MAGYLAIPVNKIDELGCTNDRLHIGRTGNGDHAFGPSAKNRTSINKIYKYALK